MEIDQYLQEKHWNPEIEKKIADKWKKSGFKFDAGRDKEKIFSIDTPPPYVNSPIHIGHAVTYTYMDFFARYKRMKGFAVLFPLGLDRNGLPIEIAAQKKFGIDPAKVGREKFLDYCMKILEEASLQSVQTFARLGISFNTYEIGDGIGDVYLTDSPLYRSLTQETFYDLWNKELIYEDKKTSNYCPGCKTTLADAEIVYKEKETQLVFIKFRTVSGEELVVATTRPELLGSCAALVYHPGDERYTYLKKTCAITPLYGKEVPLLMHSSAQKEFGSGLVMMCSFGDLSDIRFFKEMKLKPEILIGEDGRLNDKAGFLKGYSVLEARKKIVEALKEKELIMKVESIRNRYPVCERSSDPVEFIELEEYYLKQVGLKEEILKIQEKMEFFAPESRKILVSWITSVDQDWPLSRRRYYATPIPLWKCNDCDEVILGERGKYVEPWKEKKTCSKCGKEADPETRVFDTWFDSSISELYITGYKRNEKMFKKLYPATLRPQGKEIVRTWLYYTLLRGYLATGKAPFKTVWINYHILDVSRKKMSKSIGNIIDPQEIIEHEGSEAFRLWSAIEGDISKQDLACSKEKIHAEAKTVTKLWNLAKFVYQFQFATTKKFMKTDQLFLDYIEVLGEYTNLQYDRYDFHTPILKLRYFLWEIFASHYIEMVKNRAYNHNKNFSDDEQASAVNSLYVLLKKVLLLMHPVIPMITSTLYTKFGNLPDDQFPTFQLIEGKRKNEIEMKIQLLMEFNSKIWKEKRDKGLSLKSPLSIIQIPFNLIDFEKDLQSCHNAGKIERI